MTLTTTASSVTYQGNGTATVFPFAFLISDPTQIQVVLTDSTQTPPVVTTLASSQYTVMGIGSASGGNITCTDPVSGAAIITGKSLTIARIVPLIQDTSFINQGGFYPDVLEGALDYLTMECQQLSAGLAQAVTVPLGTSPVNYLAQIQTAANTAVAAQSTAATQSVNAANSASAAASSATNAATSASAASASQANAAASALSAQNYVTGLTSASTTSLTIATGLQSLTVAAGNVYAPGQFVSITAVANGANYLHGTVTSYNGATGALSVDVLDTGGSGIFASWNVAVSGTQGPLGPQGPQGPQGPAGPGGGNMINTGPSTFGQLPQYADSTGTDMVPGPLPNVANGYVRLNASTQLPSLNARNLTGFTSTQLAGVSLGAMTGLTSTQIPLITSTMIGSIGSAQITGTLTSTQIGIIGSSQMGALSSTQINGLNASGMTGIGLVEIPVRQTVLSGDIAASGQGGFLTAGSALTPAYTVNSVPLTITFASGFSTFGAMDYVSQLTAAGTTSAVQAQNVNYLFASYTSPTSVTWGYTTLQPQYGASYPLGLQSLLHFENNVLDDYGNAWVASGTPTYTPTSKFGSYAMALNGSSQYVTAPYNPNWNQPFTIDCWYKRGAVGTTQTLMGTLNSAGTNASCAFLLEFTAANVATLYYYSGSTQYSLAGSTVSDTTAFHHVAVVQDVNSNLYLFCDGTMYGPVNISTTPMNNVGPNGSPLTIGREGSSASEYFNGTIDEFHMTPRAVWTAAFTPPTAPWNITTTGESADWFSTTLYQWFYPTAASTTAGTPATCAATGARKVFVGEAVANASTITSVVSYALQGQYIQAWQGPSLPAAATAIVASDNIGTTAKESSVDILNITADVGFNPGTVVTNPTTEAAGDITPLLPQKTRNFTTYMMGSSASIYLTNGTTGSIGAATAANWQYRIRVRRAF